MIEIGVFTDEISLDLKRALEVISRLEIHKVELRTIGDKNISEIDFSEAEEINKLLRKYNVSVGVIGSPFGKCHLDNEEEYMKHLKMLDHLIRLADIFHTQIIRIFAFWKPVGPEELRVPLDGELLTRITDKLTPAVESAERAEKILALETEGSTYVGTCQEAYKVVSTINSKVLTVCWDIANGWHCGEDPLEGYNYIRGLITHLHVKDFTIDPATSKKKGCIVGEGIVPYDVIFKNLLLDGFSGMASIETHLFFGNPDRFTKLEKATIQSILNIKKILSNITIL